MNDAPAIAHDKPARDWTTDELLQNLRAMAGFNHVGWTTRRAAEEIEHLRTQLATLTDAVVALACSEVGTAAQLAAEPGWEGFDPWPEMDAVIGLLDVVRPGWRAAAHD